MRNVQRDETERGEAMRDEAAEFGAKFSEYNIIAAYENMGAAKKAIDALELAGIDGAEYKLLGATVAEAESHTDKASVHQADAALTNDLLKSAVTWGVAGGILGGAIGAILAAIPGVPLTIWYWLAIGVIVGVTMGGFIGAMSTLESGDNADMPYRPTSNRHVLVGVISQDQGRVQRAENVLSRGNPLSLHRYDRRGQLQT